MFETELNYFIKNQDKLVKKYLGKILVISNNSVLGAFENTLSAYKYAEKNLQPNTYMIQPCELGQGAYTVTISTNNIIG